MKRFCKYQIAGFVIAAFVFYAKTSGASSSFNLNLNTDAAPSISNLADENDYIQTPDSLNLPYPLKQEGTFASEGGTRTSFNLNTPSNISVTVEYDPKTKLYTIYEKVGKYNIKQPRVMSEEEYRSYQFENSMREYWRQKSAGESANAGSGLLPQMQVGGETFDRIFGSNTIQIIPQGNAELSFGITSTTTNNPNLALDLRKSTTFDFKSKIQMNVDGKIGEKLTMNVQYNTEATFDFENNVKVVYTGNEDEIIQKIEAGNVSLPLPGSLITGSQSLFGFKTQLKFGKLDVTTVFSKQNGQTEVIEVSGGAQTKTFSLSATDYEANKHFFLSAYFRDTYNKTLSNLPIINTGVNITKIEVWVTNRTSNYESSRDIVGFVDLGESKDNISSVFSAGSGVYPHNELNNLYSRMTTTYKSIRDISNVNELNALGISEGVDYESVGNARLLSSTEYTFNAKMGYISLNSKIEDDQVLAVAYEYTLGGETYKVGEFSTDGITSPSALFVKLLKGSNTLTPKIPSTWKLMMKNIYSLGAYQVSKDNFILDVLYQNDAVGTTLNYIEVGSSKKPLIEVLNLDNINSQEAQKSDGVFDFIDGYTINATTGKIIFPVIEPFGSDLKKGLGNSSVADDYLYQELYDSTLTKAKQVASKNKFKIEGSYQASSSSEISLNAVNIPKGSVVVTVGGAKLTEGVDYTVDYNLGSVKILNTGLIESGSTIKISLENNALYSMQTKTLVGAHLNYQVSDKFNIGGTILNLTERPLTQKVSYGNESISNTIWGLNTSFQTESSFLTKMVDKLPFFQTKEKSTISVDAEFAQLLPGYAKAIGKSGTVYIDDFESSTTPVDLLYPQYWKLASVPADQSTLFPEASSSTLEYGWNRSQLAWYIIDPSFPRNTASVKFSEKERSSQWVREVYEQELFPYKQTASGEATNLSILNLAFYPRERGPYNYSPDLDVNGFLTNPTKRWGGIMRSISTSDFEAQNIEYIEFWIMDPFIYDSTKEGGDLYFNLGSISEDILRDGHKSFEGGLPTTASDLKNADTSIWGRYPRVKSLLNVFATSAESQKYQDVGLDGLSSKYDVDEDGVDDEQSFFKESYLDKIKAKVSADVYTEISNDPSNDDYKYFLDSEYSTKEAGILDRYKKYNNTEGNTPYDNQSSGSSGSQDPDIEDIDKDQNMSRDESYYQYRVSLRHEDMQVGKNYITNTVYSSKYKAKWYQFKVPIAEPEKEIGSPDLTSIKFIRMFLRGFSDTLMLRFAKLQLIRGEWRKYGLSLIQGQEGTTTTDLSAGSFEISSVNLEDNSSRTPVNYVLPPGVSRTTDPSQSEVVEENEQSMEYKVLDLADGDARAGFKSVDLDMRKYRKLKMYVHTEAIPGYTLNDDDMTIFVRLGSDYTKNYYEYEIQLKVTPEGTYSNNKDSDRETVWPEENNLNITLESLTDAKLARNDAMNKSGSTVTLSTVFEQEDGDNKIKVIGNPNLGAVKIIMIGVRNPKRVSSSSSSDDGQSKSAIIWVNELRISNTDNKGGWAANARVSAKLADLGTVTVSGTTISSGFGSLESKVSDRTTADYYQYDFNATMEMGKFFPVNAGVKIPLYFSYGESFSNPEYDPLDPDIPLSVALSRATSKAKRDSIKRAVQEYTRTKSFNLTNVKIDRKNSKPWLLSLSNFSVSYSFVEKYSRNVKIDHKINREISGALTYNYNTNSKPISPLKNVKWLNSKYLRLIKDFNFNPIPSQISFRTDLDRTYSEQLLKNLSNPNEKLDPTYSKDFLWNRVYSLNWDLSQSLKFDFNANNVAQIDEPDGIVDRRDRKSYEHWRDSVLHNILNFGRTTEYTHQFNISYTLPINKIPLLDWTSATARYSGNYEWEAGPLLSDTSTYDPGNTIQNSNTIQTVGQLNLLTLYNKVGYLKRLNQKFDQMARGGKKQQKMRVVTYEEKGIRLKANTSKSINHKLKTENVTVKVYTEKGAPIKVTMDVKTDERITIKTDKEYQNVKVVVEGKVPEKTNPLKFIAEGTLRVLMGIKSFSVSYSQNNGTLVPGYEPTTKYLGLNKLNGVTAPGLAFISGWQDSNFAWEAIKNGWLSKDTTLSDPVVFTNNENLTFRTTFEPIPNLKVELNALRTYSRNHDEYYHADASGNFKAYSPSTTGSYSLSVISLGTAFKSPNKVFDDFKAARITIANRLAAIREKNGVYNPGNKNDPSQFPVGYSEISQDVLIPSFLAAYTRYKPHNVPLENFPKIPMPNWQLTYDGLAKLSPFKNYLRTFTLTHGYKSIYTIGAYTANMDYYDEMTDGLTEVTNTIDDFISKREITNVAISEQFSPLLGMDMNWINSLTSKFEVKTGRSLSMSFSNDQLTEVDSWEYIVGGGYRFENLPLIFGSDKGKEKTLKSDLRLSLDFSLRKSKTILHKLVEDINQVSSGQIATSIKASADYVISNQVTIRAYFNWAKTTPLVTGSSYPTVNTSFGFSLRFTMIQ